MNQSKKLTDGALLIVIFLVLMLASFFIPVIAIVAMFVLPVPFIIYAAKYDWKPSLLMFIVAIIVSSLFTTVYSIPLAVLAGLGGIMIGVGIHRKSSAYETWARGTVGFVAGLLFSLLFSQLVFQVDFSSEFNELINESLQTSQEMMEQFGINNQDNQDLIEEQIELFKGLLPVGLVIIALIQALISQWLSYKLINRIENRKLQFPPFRSLKFPTAIVWIYFLALIITFFQPDPNGLLFLGAQNVLMLAGTLMVIQGFSFIFFYSYKKNISKAIPIISIVLTLLFPLILLYLVRILGIIDIGFGLRGRMDKK